MPVTFFYPSDQFNNNIILYAESLSVGVVGNNKVIPIRDLQAVRTKHPVFIELGYTGRTIKLDGYIDDYNTFIKYLELYPDTLLKTTAATGNYPEFNKIMYWEIKELESKAVPGDTFLRKFTLTVVEQHYVEVRG